MFLRVEDLTLKKTKYKKGFTLTFLIKFIYNDKNKK